MKIPVALTIGVAVWLYLFRPAWRSSLAPMRTIPLTSLPGRESDPDFSPDGNQIAFVWDGGNGDNQDIYVAVIGAGTPLRVTTSPAADRKPVWSPDGRHIAFIRESAEEDGIFLVPALGGTERKIASLSRASDWKRGLSWSPDARFLVFSDKGQQAQSIFVLSIENLERRQLTFPPPLAGADDFAPAISPDGRTVAFNRVGAASGI